jgi:adenine phosphoribosyltransferase
MIDYSKYVVGSNGRSDLSLLFRDFQTFNLAVNDLVEPFRHLNITAIACLDALGFVFGAAAAKELGVGLVLVRKGGKLPVDCERAVFTDYSGKEKVFEVANAAVFPGDNLLIVDEWSSTGAQLRASISLLESMGANIVGAACFSMNAKVKEDPFFAKYILKSCITSLRTV